MPHDRTQKPLQRIFFIFSSVAFAGSTVFGMVGSYTNNFQESKDKAKIAAVSKNSQGETQEHGYEMVLQREPDNQNALERLMQV